MSVQAIHSILSADTDFSTASSGGVSSYIAKDGVSKPYSVIYADNSEPIVTQGNASGKEWRDIVVGCYADTPMVAKGMADLSRAALDGFKGSVEGISLEYCKYDGIDTEDYDRQLKKAIVEVRYRVCYTLS